MSPLWRRRDEGHRATFFVSSGRCGTQWLAAAFSEIYADLALVEHEPVGTAYNSSRLLRRDHQSAELHRSPGVVKHLARIHETLHTRDYIETGAPLYGVLPTLLDEFEGRVRLVHVVRHPVLTAASIATHGRFSRSGADQQWQEAAMLDPRRDRVNQVELAPRWEGMSNFEKSLFFWTEVNMYAEEIHREHPRVPYLRVRFEDLVAEGSAALGGLAAFMGLPPRPALDGARRNVVDRWHYTTQDQLDWRRTGDYPAALKLAALYGYSLDSVSDEQLRARYTPAG